MEDNRNSYLIKNTMIFTLGNLGSKFISFFLIPLYTNMLTTIEYGTVDLVATIATVLVPVVTLNICESVMRFALDKDADCDQITLIGTRILLIGIMIGLFIIPICFSYDAISKYAVYIYFYVISAAASQIYLCDLRGKELLIQYSVGNILYTFLIALFNILFLVFMKGGIEGYLIAYIIANVLSAIYAIIVGKGYRAFSLIPINRKLMLKMLKYSIVLIPNSFMWWIMNSSDRIMVTGMVGVAANGIYAVSYKLPTLVSTLTTIFNQAWSYSAIKQEGTEDENEYNNKIFKSLIGIVMLIGIGLMTFMKPILKIYVAEEYYIAWKYTPFLTIGSVYLTLASFMATSYTVHKDSWGYLFSGVFGAFFNIALNFLLIPQMGVQGAAAATCMSYILVFVFRLIHTKKYMEYEIKNKQFLRGSMVLLLSAVFMFLDNLVGFFIQCILLLYAVYAFSDVLTVLLKKITGIKK